VKKVTRYRNKSTGRYISKAQWMRNRASSRRAKERFVKGERKAQTPLQKLLGLAGNKPVIIRKVYKSKKHRKETHIEITMLKGTIKKIKVDYREYTRRNDIEALRSLIDHAQTISSGDSEIPSHRKATSHRRRRRS
jgi:hypothetical protein